MATYLVTGSSRGLGLNLVARLLAHPSATVGTIFATARSDASIELKELVDGSAGRVQFVKLDVTDKSLLGEDKGVDVLINNAGIMNWTNDGIHTMDDLEWTFTTNVTSVQYVTSTFLPLLRKGTQRKVVNISSTTLGSINMAPIYQQFPVPAYKVSKAALNMLTVQYALNYRKEGFTFIAISPGWLQTGLGGSNADLPVDTGAKAVLEIVHGNGKEANGKFFDVKVDGWEKHDGVNQYDGLNPPW
ncbi:hypothetical protein MMC14_006349 [Varicellaria rhodocarpa]|nr:hypothetical protein [Varicellaria rhodocarpa]